MGATSMRSFRVLFVVLLLGLGVSLAIFGYGPAPAVPADLGIGRGFSGDLLLPKAEIEAALSQARTAMLAYHTDGLRLKVGSDIAALLTFIATSAVTLILGWWGHAPRAGEPDNAAVPPGVPVRAARWIGFLAAIAAVMTGFGHFAAESSQAHFSAADRVRDQLDQTRKDVVSAKTSQDARAALDKLALQIGR
jgi:hypothetical protein